jgi:hypothetical protein
MPLLRLLSALRAHLALPRPLLRPRAAAGAADPMLFRLDGLAKAAVRSAGPGHVFRNRAPRRAA